MSDLPSPSPENLAHTPLYDLHRSLGARMIGFASYAMPVHYPTGIIEEHLHTRRQAGLFDVSHMGQAILEGRDAALRLEALVPGDILSLAPGQMRYTQFLDPDGHILDDLMVSRLPDGKHGERLLLIVNAARKADDFAHVAAALQDLTLTRREAHALLSLQGPSAAMILGRLIPAVTTMTFLTIREFAYRSADFIISRSGYTGEDGFEIALPAETAPAFVQELLAAGDVWPIGLGARDSLRLEAGLCLYGHDMDRTTDPVEAGLAWSISKRRRRHGRFIGADEVRHALADGPERRRIGLMIEGKAPAREGAEISTPDGFPIGRLTSGGYSPSLGRPIGMGLVAAPYAFAGNELRVDVRGKKLTAIMTTMPFVPHHYHRGSQ
jgi:aminomethyltransferase